MADATKLYPHYKQVAIKHFNALKMMYRKLHSDPNVGCEEYKCLLYDAFYISGYILEGASVYTIFRHIKWDPNIEIPANGSKRELMNDNNYISLSAFFNATDAESFGNSLRGHKIFDYTEYKYTHSNLPFFYGNHVRETRIPALLKEWDATKRYFLETDYNYAGLTISADNIKEIINFCRQYIISYLRKI